LAKKELRRTTPSKALKKMIPGYPTKQVQQYMMRQPQKPLEEAKQEPKSLRFQMGRTAFPARVTRCGWPTDAGKKTLGGLAVVHDPESINAIKSLEEQAQLQYPGSRLNSCFTKMVEDPDTGMPVPIVRIKYSRAPSACVSLEYGRAGDMAPQLGPPSEMADLRNGHLFVAMVAPRSWQRDGVCGVTLYANKVNCLGHRQGGAGARPDEAGGAYAETVWE
jgi:hypothetical protein